MRHVPKGKRECHFTVTTEVFLLFKSFCIKDDKTMNSVIEELMLIYIDKEKKPSE